MMKLKGSTVDIINYLLQLLHDADETLESRIILLCTRV